MNLPYVASSEAYECAQARLQNQTLQQRVAAFLGDVWPEGFEKPAEPKAVFAPYMARGSELEQTFLTSATETGCKPVVATYLQAEYVTANAGLVDCYRAPFKLPKGQQILNWVVAENNRPGAVGDAATIFEGLSIRAYWQGIRNAVMEQVTAPPATVVDFSQWYAFQARRFGWQGERAKSPFYYIALMGLYASGRAVLFDTPPTAFASKVMEPAARTVAQQLGVEPLIVNEFKASKRDWVDVSFLEERQVRRLRETGRV